MKYHVIWLYLCMFNRYFYPSKCSVLIIVTRYIYFVNQIGFAHASMSQQILLRTMQPYTFSGITSAGVDQYICK